MNRKDFFFKPRDFRSIDLWKDVTEEQWNDPLWQLKNSIHNVDQLKRVIKLSDYQEQEIRRVVDELERQGKDPLRITPYYASLMDEDPFHPDIPKEEKGSDRLDPIFWQSVPTPANLMFPNTGREAAMCEGSRSYGAAYQRYPNRVALFVAQNTSCAAYCVHCQRAKSLDATTDVNIEEINKALFYINYNENIEEVLVTGGDALRVSKKRLQYVLEELSKIDHVRVIRIATRVPVVLPMAITDEMLTLIKESANRYTKGPAKYVYFMTHVNHYREITADFAAAIKRINDHGFTVRNQTVFLNHVNDYFLTLAETFRRMLWVGVHPYYLLQCHKEKGIVHFIAPIQVGQIYMKHLQGWLSGIYRPTYAVNIEGGGGKVLLMPLNFDNLNLNVKIDEKISESGAKVHTWDDKEIYDYEALGRATPQEYKEAIETMDKFIGRKGVFVPKIILVDEEGNRIETTNRTKLPQFEKQKKAKLLGYKVDKNGMPITNPATIASELDQLYIKSEYKDKR
jgi:lysine 2,3-aminomutase